MANMGIGIMHRIMAVIAVALGIAWNGLAETVENVRGSQRENSKLVDIYYDLNDSDGGTYYVEVEIVGRTNDVSASTFSGDVGEGVVSGQNRHVVWDAEADWPGNKGDVKAVVTAIKGGKPNKVQLWEGGPYWADRNIGAEYPWDYGLYFWWGDTVGHRPSGTTFEFNFDRSNCPTYGKNTDQLLSEKWITSDGVLSRSHDAAHVKWGGSWRMPTSQEIVDITNKCDWVWTTINGTKGCVVRGRGTYASNSIFLPFAGLGSWTSFTHDGLRGQYWLSDCSIYSRPFRFQFYYSDRNNKIVRNLSDVLERYRGYSIRPVQGSYK